MKRNPGIVIISIFFLLTLTAAYGAEKDEPDLDSDDFTGKRFVNEGALAEINQQYARYGRLAMPWSGAILHGTNTCSIKVIDNRTLRPVTNYDIHAFLFGHYVQRRPAREIHPERGDRLERNWELTPGEYKEEDRRVRIGRLESKRVKNADGTCRYEGLGVVEVEFLVWARGYMAQSCKTKLPGGESSIQIRLTPACGVEGRIVDADRVPMRKMAVMLNYPRSHAGQPHTSWAYEVQTDEQGYFEFYPLPPDVYTFEFPELIGSFGDLDRVVEQVFSSARLAEPTGRLDPKRERALREAELARPRPIAPKLPPLHLNRLGMHDVGTIRLESSPVLDLELVDAAGAPLGDFPFEIQYRKAILSQSDFRARTNPQGKARLALAGWAEGMKVGIYIPIINSINSNRTKSEASQFTSALARLFAQNKPLERQAANDEHPNYRIITPNAGETRKVRIAYQPEAGALAPRFLFRDKTTGRPVPEFTGVLVQGSGNYSIYLNHSNIEATLAELNGTERVLRSRDRSGRATLAALTLSESLLEAAKHPKTPKPEKQSRYGIAPEPALHLVVDAPGYVRQAFDITLDQIRSDRELVIDLEPEAHVRGRVVLEETGEPLTSTTLIALLKLHGKWSELKKIGNGSVPRNGMPPDMGLNLENMRLEGEERDQNTQDHYRSMAGVKFDRDGRFEIQGLKPDAHWSYKLVVEGLPETSLTKLALATGDNDLGEIRVGIAGTLVVKAADAEGKALPGAWFSLPVEPYLHEFEHKTNASGEISLNMTPLRTFRQIVRLSPPWGYKTRDQGQDVWAWINYDAITELDRRGLNRVTARMRRGHGLTIEIPRSAARDRIQAVVDSDMNSERPTFAERGKSYAAAGYPALVALTPDENGFIYNQCDFMHTGVRLTSGTVTLQMNDVPPGRYGLCVDWGINRLYAFQNRPEYADDPIPPPQEWTEFDPIAPLGYTELEMPDTTTTVKLEMNAADVEVTLQGAPASEEELGVDRYRPGLQMIIILEREGPLVMAGISGARKILAEGMVRRTPDPDVLAYPLVNYEQSFYAYWEKNGSMRIRPARFCAVPPGKYRLRAYTCSKAQMNSEPYFERTVEVGRNAGVIKVDLPYKAPSKSEPPRPAVQ